MSSKQKIAIYTPELDVHISGGILCIVSILEHLFRDGYDVCCFVDRGTKSQWLPHEFPIYYSSSKEYKNFDGVLISPFSPTAKAVAEHPNASEKLYHIHTNEVMFRYNGPEWTQQAIDSYSLPLKLFCTSHYVRILMEMQYSRRVIGTLVPPGYDPKVFFCPAEKDKNGKLKVLVFGRTHSIRGLDIAMKGIDNASKSIPIDFRAIPDGTRDRRAVAEYYKWADVFIDTSRLAGSPTPIKESMACGAIPICTPYGTTDFVLNEFNGYIVPVDDSQAVKGALLDFWTRSDRNKLRMMDNVLSIMRDYTWTSIANRFLSAIEEGIDRGDELLQPKQW